MKKRGTKQQYSSKLVAQIVAEYEHSELGLRDLEKKYGVKYGTIYSWVKKERERRCQGAVPRDRK